METIKNYLDNMFANLPKTVEMLSLKEDILFNMEEKYQELKDNGKSENEAIGIVISEFGNIDELISEYDLSNDLADETIKSLTEQEVYEYLEDKKRTGAFVGLGVILCIMGAALLVLITQLAEDNIILGGMNQNFKDLLGVIVLLCLIVPAVGIFIFTGTKMEKYKYLRNDFILSSNLRANLQQMHQDYSYYQVRAIFVGVSLCILSPIAIFVASLWGDSGSTYGVVILLFIISIAVFIFIYFGGIGESYKILLKIDNYGTYKNEKNNRVIGAVAAIVWPLAVCIFLASGLVYDKWAINWIVFPITGILFGMFCSVYSILTRDDRRD
jgi:hypothetical protein